MPSNRDHIGSGTFASEHSPPVAITGNVLTDDEETSLVAVLNVLLRNRRLILSVAVVCALLMLGITLLLPRTYTSYATFIPQNKKLSSSMAGLAAQFGVTIPTGDATASPPFYIDLLSSRAVLEPVVDSLSHPSPNTNGSTILELLKAKGETPAQRREDAIERLDKIVTPTFSQKTGIVRVEVQTKSPTWSYAITQRVVQSLETFNREKQQTQASAERRFSASRLDEVGLELRTAEDRLQRFLQSNRNYANAPELSFQHDRLLRAVNFEQDLYNTLAQSVEQAKIEEVRDTPIITFIESPTLPVRPDPRDAAKHAIIAGIVGLMLGIVFALFRSFVLTNQERHPDELAELAQLRKDALDDLLFVFRPFRAKRQATSQARRSA